MKGVNQFLIQVVMVLLFFTFASVSISTLGAVIDSVYLTKFWYLAFFSLIMIIVTLALVILMYVLNQGIKSYRNSQHTRGRYGVEL